MKKLLLIKIRYWALLIMGVVITCFACNNSPQKTVKSLFKSSNTTSTIEEKCGFHGQLDPTIDKYGRKLYNKEQGNTSGFDGLGLPIANNLTNSQILYRASYVISYNSDYKLPNWVMWKLTANHTDGVFKRPSNAWHEDTDVPCPRATIIDYRGSGWSRGHMCPAGDNKWDRIAMYDTFLLSNCCPQNANLNSGVWNEIEIACRRWAKQYDCIYIICGPIFLRTEHKRIGTNNITVPEAFFKVVLCLGEKPKGIGFVCRNTDGQRKKDNYVNSIKQVERITGMIFFPNLDKELSNMIKNNCDLSLWN